MSDEQRVEARSQKKECQEVTGQQAIFLLTAKYHPVTLASEKQMLMQIIQASPYL